MSDNPFADAKSRLQAMEAALRRLREEMETKCDWDDPEDVSRYKRAVRREGRVAKMPDNFICPTCRSFRPNPLQWVMQGEVVVCVTCWKFARQRKKGEIIRMEIKIFEEIRRFKLDGQFLRQARNELQLGTREFARRAGWSESYQMQLENGTVKTVDADKAATILQVINEEGGITLDFVDPSPIGQ